MADLERFQQGLKELDGEAFRWILDAVPALAGGNNLSLVNLAAACLDQGEIYLEVGAYQGASLTAAMHGNRGDFVVIDDWSMPGASRGQVVQQVVVYGDPRAVTLLDGDAYEILGGNTLYSRVGVYYWDAHHGYDEQLRGLRAIVPHLAARALILVDDPDWATVAGAVETWLKEQPQARQVFRAYGSEAGCPGGDGCSEWWNGALALAWETL